MNEKDLKDSLKELSANILSLQLEVTKIKTSFHVFITVCLFLGGIIGWFIQRDLNQFDATNYKQDQAIAVIHEKLYINGDNKWILKK